MSPPDPENRLTHDEFKTAIRTALQAAQADNVDVEGALRIPDSSSNTLDWSVEITRVQR